MRSSITANLASVLSVTPMYRLELIHCALHAVAARMGTITIDTSVLYEWGNRALLCGDLWTRVPGVIGYFCFKKFRKIQTANW